MFSKNEKGEEKNPKFKIIIKRNIKNLIEICAIAPHKNLKVWSYVICYNINLIVEIFISIIIPIRDANPFIPSICIQVFTFVFQSPNFIHDYHSILMQHKPFCIESVIRHISFIDLISVHPFMDNLIFVINFTYQ
jgi:hypothetical protein